MADNTSGFTYDATLDGLCERVTYILGDAEKGYPNTTWEKPFLQAIACDALFMLASVKPELFKADTVKIELTAETFKQTVDCDECELILSFVCFEREDGSVIPAIDTEYSQIQRAALLPAPCANCEGGVMSRVPSIQVAMSKDSVDVFGINPMFPADEKLFAVVRCRNLKKYYEGNLDLPDGLRSHFPALIQLMLYLALSGDRVEGGLAQLANQHWANFAQSVGLSFQQADFLQRQAERN